MGDSGRILSRRAKHAVTTREQKVGHPAHRAWGDTRREEATAGQRHQQSIRDKCA